MKKPADRALIMPPRKKRKVNPSSTPTVAQTIIEENFSGSSDVLLRNGHVLKIWYNQSQHNQKTANIVEEKLGPAVRVPASNIRWLLEKTIRKYKHLNREADLSKLKDVCNKEFTMYKHIEMTVSDQPAESPPPPIIEAVASPSSPIDIVEPDESAPVAGLTIESPAVSRSSRHVLTPNEVKMKERLAYISKLRSEEKNKYKCTIKALKLEIKYLRRQVKTMDTTLERKTRMLAQKSAIIARNKDMELKKQLDKRQKAVAKRSRNEQLKRIGQENHTPPLAINNEVDASLVDGKAQDEIDWTKLTDTSNATQQSSDLDPAMSFCTKIDSKEDIKKKVTELDCQCDSAKPCDDIGSVEHTYMRNSTQDGSDLDSAGSVCIEIDSSVIASEVQIHERSGPRGDVLVSTGYTLGDAGYRCDTCRITLRRQAAMIAHVKKHQDVNVDGRESESEENSCEDYSSDDVEERIAVCVICSKQFKGRSRLQLHHQNFHNAVLYQCDTCGKVLKGKGSFKGHMLLHKPPEFKCEICGHTAITKGHLNRHKKIHTSDKPFMCDTCGKSFRRPDTLTLHKRIHTGERPFVCKTCGHAFKSWAGLDRHTQLHTHQKVHTCEVCGNSFIQKTELYNHWKKHPDYSPGELDTRPAHQARMQLASHD